MSAAPWRGAVASLALTAASLTSVVGPAGADEGLAEPTVKMIYADTLRHAAADRQTARAREHVRTNFLTDSANNGRLYDASEVKTAVVDDVTVAWPLGVDVSRVVTATEAATGKVGLAVVASNSPTPADQAIARMGSQELRGIAGQWGDLEGGVVQVTSQGFKILSGWDRYRVRETKTDREVYYYGHWVTAYGHHESMWDDAPYIVEAASRPKRGLRWTFLQLRNYWPKVDEPSCSGGELSVSVLGFGGSLPLQNCSSLWPDADANDIKVDVVWSAGACKDQTVEGADLGMAVDVDPGRKAILSDYAYAQFSGGSSRPCDTKQSDNIRVIYADPGW